MYAKKNSGKKILAMALAVVLLIGVGVGGTLAWLTAQSETVTNTFTVGDINITLQEHPFKANSTTELDTEATPVKEITTYKVVPGGKQPKDPFVTVKANSENCYVYVNIENQLAIDGTIVVTYNIDSNSWERIADKTDDTTGAVSTLYRYKSEVAYSTADQNQTVFTEVSYSNTILKDNSATDLEIGQLAGKKIILNAFAHQSDNIENVSVADEAAKAHFEY